MANGAVASLRYVAYGYDAHFRKLNKIVNVCMIRKYVRVIIALSVL